MSAVTTYDRLKQELSDLDEQAQAECLEETDQLLSELECS